MVLRPEERDRHAEITEHGGWRAYRATLGDDLAQAQLPSELVSAVERAAVDAQSVDDLAGLIGACLTVKDLVTQMNGD